MGLPAGQQRTLDTIEEALRTAEPRLAAMFSIFTRLTGNEARPHREQLPSARGWRTRLRCPLSHRRARTGRPRQAATEPGGLLRLGGQRLPRLLMLGQLMAILLVVGLLIGISATMRPTACSSAAATHSAARAATDCRSAMISDGK
jgi:hypothetical protein